MVLFIHRCIHTYNLYQHLRYRYLPRLIIFLDIGISLKTTNNIGIGNDIGYDEHIGIIINQMKISI